MLLNTSSNYICHIVNILSTINTVKSLKFQKDEYKLILINSTIIVTKLHHHIIGIVNIEFVVHTTPTLEWYECSCALSSAQGPTASRSRQLALPLVVPHHRFVVLRISLCFHALLSQSFGWHWIACLVKMSSKRGLAVRRVL